MLAEKLSNLDKYFRRHHYKSLFNRIREKDGSLSATEAYSADVIYLLGEPTIKQFSEFLDISQPNATYKVANLAAKGYIDKIPSEDDHREFHLILTKKFYNYYDVRDKFFAESANILKEKFSKEDIDKFTEMLSVIIETEK